MITTILKRIVRPKVSRLNLALTYRCNQRCTFCNIWSIPQDEKREELSAGEVGEIAKANDLIWFSFTGGEPCLRDDLPDVLFAAARHSEVVSLVTNGARPAHIEDSVRRVLTSCDSRLTLGVSILGDKEQHDEATQTVGSYNRAVETLQRLYPLQGRKFLLLVESTVSKDIGPPISPVPVKVLYNPYYDAPYYRNSWGQISMSNGWGTPPPLGSPFSHLGALQDLYLLRQRSNRRTQCVAGQYSCAVDPYGGIYPCLMVIPNHCVGNVRDGFLLPQDMSSRTKELRKQCRDCWTPCEAYTTIIFRPWHLLS